MNELIEVVQMKNETLVLKNADLCNKLMCQTTLKQYVDK